MHLHKNFIIQNFFINVKKHEITRFAFRTYNSILAPLNRIRRVCRALVKSTHEQTQSHSHKHKHIYTGLL